MIGIIAFLLFIVFMTMDSKDIDIELTRKHIEKINEDGEYID